MLGCTASTQETCEEEKERERETEPRWSSWTDMARAHGQPREREKMLLIRYSLSRAAPSRSAFISLSLSLLLDVSSFAAGWGRPLLFCVRRPFIFLLLLLDYLLDLESFFSFLSLSLMKPIQMKRGAGRDASTACVILLGRWVFGTSSTQGKVMDLAILITATKGPSFIACQGVQLLLDDMALL